MTPLRVLILMPVALILRWWLFQFYLVGSPGRARYDNVSVVLSSAYQAPAPLYPYTTLTPPPTTSPSLAPTLQYVKLLSLLQIFKSSRKKYKHYITNYVLLWYFTLHTKHSHNYGLHNIKAILLYPQEVARLMEPVLFVT